MNSSGCVERTSSCSPGGWKRPGRCVPRWPGACRPWPASTATASRRGLVQRNPAANLRRPKVDDESPTLGLDRNELGAFLVQAGLGSARDHALASLLALNGLRISEALGADIDDLEFERGHRTLKIIRKGGKPAIIPLAPRTSRALDLYIGERTSGPIFVGAKGERMDRYAADRTVKRLARRAGITKRISPHSVRHSFITAALDAGVPLRDVQEAASHADPRTTTRYDRGRGWLDGHAPTSWRRSSPERRREHRGERAISGAGNARSRRLSRARRGGDRRPSGTPRASFSPSPR